MLVQEKEYLLQDVITKFKKERLEAWKQWWAGPALEGNLGPCVHQVGAGPGCWCGVRA